MTVEGGGGGGGLYYLVGNTLVLERLLCYWGIHGGHELDNIQEIKKYFQGKAFLVSHIVIPIRSIHIYAC